MSSPNQIPKGLNLEKEGREISLLTSNYRVQEEVTLVGILTSGCGFCQFPQNPILHTPESGVYSEECKFWYLPEFDKVFHEF